MSTCDNFLALSLFSSDGYYDDSCLILDKDKDGINWGLKIFQYYKERSELIDIKDYFGKQGCLKPNK